MTAGLVCRDGGSQGEIEGLGHSQLGNYSSEVVLGRVGPQEGGAHERLQHRVAPWERGGAMGSSQLGDQVAG